MTDTNEPPEETTHIPFPCDFPVKIIGFQSEDFERAALSIVRKHFPNLTEGSLRYQPSKDNKFLAITVVVHAKDKAQLDALYRDLSVEPQVFMAL